MNKQNRIDCTASKKSFWLYILMAILLVSLAACQSLPFTVQVPWQTQAPRSTPTPTIEAALTSQPVITETQPTPTAALPPKQLTVWVPPEMNPMGRDPAAEMLRARLNEFTHSYNVEIEVRIKAVSGQAGLLDSLRSTNEAAPAVLPDLILLPEQDLDVAAHDGLIFSAETLLTLMNDPDWYGYGRSMSLYKDIVYGIPFAGDPLVMVYDGQNQLAPANEWEGIPTNYGYFGFAADDPQASFVMTLYLAAGGKITDTQGRPMLEESPLTSVLQLLKDAFTARHINTHSLEMQSANQVWEGYDTWMFDTAIVPAHLVLAGAKQSRIELPKPALAQPARTTATGWVWALSSPAPERQTMAASLLESLVQTDFLAEWTESFGILPLRPSALGAWQNETLKPALEKISSGAVLFPPNEIMNSLGPVLRNATLAILRDGADPRETARLSVESVQ